MMASFGVWFESFFLSSVILVSLVAISVYLSVWVDSKLGADLQARVGPNCAGSAGFLQPLADFLGSLTRFRSIKRDPRMRWTWWLPGAPLFAMLAIVPVGVRGPLLQAHLAVFSPTFLALCYGLAGLLVNWQAEGVEARFISLRRSAVIIATVPAVLMSILVVGMTAGGFEWQTIRDCQSFLPMQWLAFSNPSALISSLVFLGAGMLIFGVPPFSVVRPQYVSLFSGNIGAVGLQETWGRLGLRLAPVCWNLMAVGMFFGGDTLPASLVNAFVDVPVVILILGVGVLIIKFLVIQSFFSLLGRTLPALRADQATDFAWR
ncbi:MAG: NADH-quinone oxidoreductase subunit H, partial [Bdellovibrionales bacterium]|nr:NADH-quinone oxidoreductase subunit H [Bdellovibrionales bacterium]